MGDLVQAAQEYLAEYNIIKAATYLSYEFGISRGYAMQVCEQVEQEQFAYCGA